MIFLRHPQSQSYSSPQNIHFSWRDDEVICLISSHANNKKLCKYYTSMCQLRDSLLLTSYTRTTKNRWLATMFRPTFENTLVPFVRYQSQRLEQYFVDR